MSDHSINPRASKPSTYRGFSLIELSAVVVILGALSAVTIASMSPAEHTRQQAAARTMVTMLNRQRALALLTGVGRWTTFNTSANTYSFAVDSVSMAGRANAVSEVDPDLGGPWSISLNAGGSAGVLLTSLSINGGGTDLGYDWRGRPVNSGGTPLTTDAVITLTGPTTVTIRAGTGLASTP